MHEKRIHTQHTIHNVSHPIKKIKRHSEFKEVGKDDGKLKVGKKSIKTNT